MQFVNVDYYFMTFPSLFTDYSNANIIPFSQFDTQSIHIGFYPDNCRMRFEAPSKPALRVLAHFIAISDDE